MRVLLVEDDGIIALDLMLQLGETGHDVVATAASTAEAVAAAARQKPELALVDLHLAQGSSGAEVALALKGQFGIPSLFVTANGDEARRWRHAAIGCLKKPFDSSELAQVLAAIQRCLTGESPGQIPSKLELYPAAGPGASG